MRGSTASMKSEELCVHGRPIGQPSRRSMFAKNFVGSKPNPSAKLARNSARLITCTRLNLSNDEGKTMLGQASTP